jgi:hypothetical protein
MPKDISLQIENNSQRANTPLLKKEQAELDKYWESLQEEEKQNINLNKPQEYGNVYDILEKDFSS